MIIIPGPSEMNNSSFFLEEGINKGQFDWNADLYAGKQQEFANDLADLTNYELWQRKEKYSDYDCNITRKGTEDYAGAAIVIPGIPVVGLAELKYRTNTSTQFPTTVVDLDKMTKLITRSITSHLPVWICWRFADCDMYYQVDPEHKFEIEMFRNTKCTDDVPWENKPVSHIPISYLTPVKKEMFENGS